MSSVSRGQFAAATKGWTIWSNTSLPTLSSEVSIIFPDIFILFPNNGLSPNSLSHRYSSIWERYCLSIQTLPLLSSRYYTCRSIALGENAWNYFIFSFFGVTHRKFTLILLSSIPSITYHCAFPSSMTLADTVPFRKLILTGCLQYKQFLENYL